MLQWGMLKTLLLTSLLAGSLALHAMEDDEDRPKVFGEHHGYVFDVVDERSKRDIEMVMLERQKESPPPLTERIFNEKLSKEFQSQYQYRFGQTTTEQALNNPSRSDGYTYYTGETLTIQRYQEEQRHFATYMGRRLTEFHVDNYAKNDPDLKPVYEMKDKISNVNVNVQKFKFKWKYNFAGPNMDVSIENPYGIEFRARAEMTGVVSSPNEMIYTLGYQLTPRIRVKALHNTWDGLTQLITTRQMTKSISCSLTGSQDTKPQGRAVQQDLILVGLAWSD